MKLFCCFLAFIFFIAGVNSQEIRKLDTVTIYRPFISFFLRYPEIKEIRFNARWLTDFPEIEIIEKDTSAIKTFNQFDLSEESDRYFFQKRFGTFSIPSAIYEKYLDSKANLIRIFGIIRLDSVFLSASQQYYHSEDEILFVKVGQKWGYEKGLHALAKQMEDSLSPLEVSRTDSLIQLLLLVGKDGIVEIKEIKKGNKESEFTKAVIRFICATSPWVPYQTGGFKVKVYRNLYIRLNTDRTFTIAMGTY